MVALGYMAAAFLGNCVTPQVDGLACTPTSPATLQVNVGVGSLYSAQTVDASAFGDLGTDTTHTIVKQGLLQDPATLTITPPGTVGYSQVFLVQAIFAEVDGGSTVLPYYNAANPSVPFSGPANAGTSNFTVRQGKITVSLKAGTAATTGTQTTPAPDSGYVGLYAITVANGATTITSGNIVALSTAPFIPTKLPTVPADVQSGKWVYAVATGSANSWAVATNPALAAYAAGRILWIKAPATNTSTAVVINISGLGTRAIKKADATVPQIGDLVSGSWYPTIDDGTNVCIITTLPSDTVAAANANKTVLAYGAGTTNWVAPPGITKVKAYGRGGAGGGGGATGASFGAGGGSGGSFFLGNYTVVPGTSYSIVVGAGGAGGSAAGSNGSNGNLTSFGAFASAPGGLGGAVANAGSSNGGAAPANATGGQINWPGVAGGNGQAVGGAGQGGTGGGSYGQSAANINPVGGGAGIGGQLPGIGGNGGGGAGFAGGAGAAGELVLEF
jgi:hypothetical protein